MFRHDVYEEVNNDAKKHAESLERLKKIITNRVIINVVVLSVLTIAAGICWIWNIGIALILEGLISCVSVSAAFLQLQAYEIIQLIDSVNTDGPTNPEIMKFLDDQSTKYRVFSQKMIKGATTGAVNGTILSIAFLVAASIVQSIWFIQSWVYIILRVGGCLELSIGVYHAFRALTMLIYNKKRKE